MNVSINIKKPNLLSDWSHGVDLTKCKQKKRSSILKYKSNIASKPATGMQSYTLTKSKHLTSLKAVELGSLEHVQDVSNLQITGNALSATASFQKQQRYVSGTYLLTLIEQSTE